MKYVLLRSVRGVVPCMLMPNIRMLRMQPSWPDSASASFDPVQLNKILTGKIIQVNPYISERSQGIEGYSTPKDLETALQLIYLRFTAPRKDEALL